MRRAVAGSMTPSYPSRIICLTEEPTEVLSALGQPHRIVGISGFTVRPARALNELHRLIAAWAARQAQHAA